MVNRIPARSFENDSRQLENSMQVALETTWTTYQWFFKISLRHFELNATTLAAIFGKRAYNLNLQTKLLDEVI
jgi:hypothetical protein